MALLCICIAPKEQIGLSPYEVLYRISFVYFNDLSLDPEVQTLLFYTIAIGQFQQDICLWGVNQNPKYSKEPPLYAPGTQALIKVWKNGPQRLNSSPYGRSPTLQYFQPPQQSKNQDTIPRFTTQESSCGRKQKRTLNIPVSPWEISDTYSEQQMSAIPMNTPKIQFL